jgi:hypothetical protein
MPRSTEPRVPKEHVAVRLNKPDVDRIDALLSLYALPGRDPNRSDALRGVIHAGLVVEERRARRAASRR